MTQKEMDAENWDLELLREAECLMIQCHVWLNKTKCLPNSIYLEFHILDFFYCAENVGSLTQMLCSLMNYFDWSNSNSAECSNVTAAAALIMVGFIKISVRLCQDMMPYSASVPKR